MKRIAFVATLLVGTMFAGLASADDRDFKLINATGYQIKHVFIDEASSDSWSEDVLGRDTLDDGDSVEIQFGKGDKGCKWDMKVVYSDGESAVWSKLDLCSIESVKLKWSKATGETTAIVK